MSRRGRSYHHSSSSSENSPPRSSSARRRLPSPPRSGILRSRSSSRHVTIVDPLTLSRRVERIADNLEDANRNLNNVDSKMTGFKDIHDDSMSALSKLRNDLEGSLSKLRNEREKRSTARENYSLHQSELLGSGTERRRPASSIGFDRTRNNERGDSMHHSLRNLRDQVSDLATQQSQLQKDHNADMSRSRVLREVNGESAAERVERRLQQMEHEITKERDKSEKFASEAVQNITKRSQKTQEEEAALRNQLLQTESRKRSLESDLDSMRRRLEQSEGGKDALMTQIADLRNQLNQGEKERSDMQQVLQKQLSMQQMAREKEEEEKRMLALSHRQNADKRKQDEELSELKSALRQSVGIVQLEDMRKSLEKSERQRQQLSDHIEVLTKDLEKKEQAQGRVLKQLNETQQIAQAHQIEKERLASQLDNALNKLDEYKRDTDKCLSDLRRYEQVCDETEKEKESLRETTQDNIRQLKSKCKILEKENERLQDNVDKLNSKNEALVKDCHASKSQANGAFQQCESLRNEMDNLISRRADMEERLHRREDEIERVQEEVNSVSRKFEESADVIRRLEDEIRQHIEKNAVLKDEDRRKSEEMLSLRALVDGNKEQCNQLQVEIRNLTKEKGQSENKLNEEKIEHGISMKKIKEMEKQCEAMSLELSASHKQLEIERETHKKEMGKARKHLHGNQIQHDDNMQKFTKAFDKEREFLEAEVHRINLEANEHKAARRDGERKLNAAIDKVKKLEDKISCLHDEVKNIHTKYQEAQTTFDAKIEMILEENNKLRRKEDELFDALEKIKMLEGDIEIMQSSVNEEIDHLECAVFDLNESESKKKHKATFRLYEANLWCSKVKKILATICNELVEREDKRRTQVGEYNKSKTEYKELCRKLEDDQITLMSEVTKQNQLVDTLSREKTSLLIENNEARMIVQDLQDRLAHNTTIESDMRNTVVAGKSFERPVKLSASINQNSQKEREKIQERYNKYKQTFEQLENELKENRCSDVTKSNSEKGNRQNSRTPSPIKKVTINESPTRHSYGRISNPINSSSPKPTKEF